MRKSKKCCSSKVEMFGTMVRMRTCILERNHKDDHLDTHGRWKEPK